MEIRDQVIGDDTFAKWERIMARHKAWKTVGKFGITPEDAKDIEQELLIQILIKRGRYNAEHDSKSTEREFLSYVLDKAIANIFQSRRQDKRAVHLNPRSLDQEIEQSEGDTLPFGELFSEDHSLSRMGRRSHAEERDMRLDIKRLLDRLAPEDRHIGTLVMAGHKPSEVGRALGKARATLDRQIARMRKILYEEGLRDYL